METLKVFGLIFVLSGAYLWASSDDYHKLFDKQVVIRYNCNMLMGSWHPDVPREVIDQCRKTQRESVYVKTYQE